MGIDFTCPYCGRHVNVASQYAGQTGPCGQCGQAITIPGSPVGVPFQPPVYEDLGDNVGMRMLLPVGRSVWAIVAGYAGLMAIIPIFAPVALICGIIAIVDIRRNPRHHGLGRAIFGLVMGVLFSIFWIFVFVGMAAGGFR